MNSYNRIINKQKEICKKYGLCFYPSNANSIIGISLDVLDPKKLPINGLRYHPENNANGWFVWRGAEPLSKDDDYFKSMHVEHLFKICPDILTYLGLPPGWRFLLAPNYVDIWFDQNIYDMH